MVSAQFWVFRLPASRAADTVAVAERLFRWSVKIFFNLLMTNYRSATRVPYLVRLFLFWREAEAGDEAEVELRVVLATEGERVMEDPLE